MKPGKLFRMSCVALLLLVCFAGRLSQAQDLCTFDPTVGQGPIPGPPPQAVPSYYPWRAGTRSDQSTVPGQHSGLVGWVGNVDDQTFAQSTINAIVAGGGNYGNMPLVYVFGECYGGGMIDDLAGLVVANPMSIVSASFYNQTASYPIPVNMGGNGTDFIWAYVRALANLNNPTAQKTAAQASNDDPFGWGFKPNPARGVEIRGSETPEYWAQANGNGIALKRAANEVNSVILWAGHPKQVDDAQLAQLITTLLALGYSKDNIVVLFGSGRPLNSQVATVMQANNFDPTHLRQADLNQLLIVLQQWAFPAGVNNPPQFLLFLAADHGCNNAFQAVAKSGNGGNDIYDGGDWGNGDSDDPPYPPRY